MFGHKISKNVLENLIKSGRARGTHDPVEFLTDLVHSWEGSLRFWKDERKQRVQDLADLDRRIKDIEKELDWTRAVLPAMKKFVKEG